MTKLRPLILVLSVLVFLGAGGYLAYDFLSAEKEQNDLDQLAQIVEQVEQAAQESGEAQEERPRVRAVVELIEPGEPERPDGGEQGAARATPAARSASDGHSAPDVPGSPDAGEAIPDGQQEQVILKQADGGETVTPDEQDGQATETAQITPKPPGAGETVTPDEQDEQATETAQITPEPLDAGETVTPDEQDEQVTETAQTTPEPLGAEQTIPDEQGMRTTPEPETAEPTQASESGEPLQPSASAAPTAPAKESALDRYALAGFVQEYLEWDTTYAYPAIETLRIRIDPPARPTGEPGAQVKFGGEFLYAQPNPARLETALVDYVESTGWQGRWPELIDMRVHIETLILPKYRTLYEENRDLVGWIQIEGTKINYPVMQNVNDPEYYLRRNFDHKYAYGGLPFLDARCDRNVPGTNLVVYGHNMKNGTMFGQIKEYADVEFWRKHAIVQFDLLTEERTYEVLGIFRSREYEEGEEGFRYYDYIDLSKAEIFNEYIAQVKQASIFDTGITAEWGDDLLTLSTCSSYTREGRFVLVAKRIQR